MRACMGVVAIPVFPPHPAKRTRIFHFASIQSSSGATVALQILPTIGANVLLASSKSSIVGQQSDEMKWIVTDNIVLASVEKTGIKDSRQ